MADVFREVDEDLRREQLKKLWDRYAPYILGLAVLIVLGVSAYKILEYWQRYQAESSGDKYVAALNLADAGKGDEAMAALRAVNRDGSGAYPVLALFSVASQKADTGDARGAVADFDAIAARGEVSPDIRNMARLRAAMLLVDTAPVAEITRRVSDLAAIGNPWRHNAREALALSAWHAGDFAGAKTYFDQINADQEAPSDMRQRAQVMISLIAAKQLGATAPAAAATAPAVLPVLPTAPRPAASGFAPSATPLAPLSTEAPAAAPSAATPVAPEAGPTVSPSVAPAAPSVTPAAPDPAAPTAAPAAPATAPETPAPPTAASPAPTGG